MIEAPQSFVVREECEKAAFQNGFRRPLGENEGWSAFASTTARGTIHLAAACIHGPWCLALDHGGIIAELDLPIAAMAGSGKARCVFETLGELYPVLNRVYALSVNLPDAPLREFELRVVDLPRTTGPFALIARSRSPCISQHLTSWPSRSSTSCEPCSQRLIVQLGRHRPADGDHRCSAQILRHGVTADADRGGNAAFAVAGDVFETQNFSDLTH